MEQRRLRLGDAVDDYCPRERRITDHAIVAIVEDEIKQTRCTACDTEHVYKGGKLPATRRRSPAAGLYEQVLATRSGPHRGTGGLGKTDVGRETTTEDVAEASAEEPAGPEATAVPADSQDTPDERRDELTVPEEERRVHRPLIRATLPRPEGQVPTRQAPEFTVRQSGTFSGPQKDARGRAGQRPARAPRNGGKPHGSFGQSRLEGQKPRKPFRKTADKYGSAPPGRRPSDRSQLHPPHARHGSDQKKRSRR